MTTLSRHLLSNRLLALAICGTVSCGDSAAGGPSPTRYDWPERFAFNVDFVLSTQRDGREVLRYTESRTLRFGVRDDESYLVASDSVIKTRSEPDRQLEYLPLSAGDTLAWYLSLGSLGELRGIMPACDPALGECRGTLRSVLPLQLRRIVPRLSEWPVPAGSRWADTLEFDDATRPGGGRGSQVTTYRMGRDTTVGGEAYWKLEWHAVLRTYGAAGMSAIMGARPIEEDGVTLVHKTRLLPLYSAWMGAVVVGSDSGRVVATGFRGRASLAGSVFDAGPAARR